MRLRNLTRCISLAVAALVTVIAAEYHGEVRFAGLPLPGVTVTATQGDNSVTAATDPKGVFSFADLPDGHWSLRVEKLGFSTATQEVTVSADSPGAWFELKMFSPSEMRAVAVPGAKGFERSILNGTITPAPPTPAPEITSELEQRAADGFLINGSALNGAASRFSQAPTFGNARKGGPRLYTYAIALSDSNSVLNAANYSLTGQHTLKPPFNNVTGTISFGGPLKIPRLLPHNGPTFTVNYSRIENRMSSVYTGLMPDAAERGGDFSQAAEAGKPVTIYDPAAGAPFSGNVIPLSRISPQALSLLQYYPAPNFSGTNGYNYQVPLIANTHTDNLRVALQKVFKRRNNFSGLFGMQDTRGDSNSQFNFLDLKRSLGTNSSAVYRRTFSPRFYTTLTYQFSRQSTRLLPFFADRVNVSGEAGITGNNQDTLNWGPPVLQFNQSSMAGLSDGTASLVHNQTSSVSYLGTWSHHQHNIQFGADYRWQQFNTISQSNPRGLFTFSGAATGFDFADFLLGIPDASAIAFGNADKYLRAVQSDLYFQDDWRIASGVTILLGLRWEYTSPITEKYGRLVNLDIAPGFTAIAPVVASDPKGPGFGGEPGQSYPDSLIRPYYREFEPRVGIAWRPLAASSMVIRAGYGISYNTQVYLPFANQMVQQSPLSTSLNVANTPANPLTLANGFYAPPNVATNTVAIDPNFKVGYAQVWNLIVQQDLPNGLQMVATYTGTKGTHQLQAFAPNTYATGPLSPYGYTYYTSYGNSTREAGIMQLRRRLHSGFAAQVQYTYSKSIDDAAALGGGTLGVVAQNWLDLAAERGPSSFDQRHLANITLQYTSGMGLGGGTLLGGWRGRFAKDWTFLDSINVGSGLPLTPVYAQLCPGTGIPCSVRADYTGASLYDAPASYFLNPAAVTAPSAGEWGNAGRDSMTGPRQFSMSASMARAFRLSDRVTLNLRVDATNPLNHVVVTQLNTTVTNPLFGLPAAVNGMRAVITSLRVTF
jgi:trimeric autotransporter adhesin